MTKTIIRRHYMLTMRLDLSHVDEDKLRVASHCLYTAQAVPSTLQAEQARDPSAVRRAYDCHNECRKQQPPVELRREPIALDRWTAAFDGGANAAPEWYFLALHKGEFVGVCLFETNPDSPDTLVSGFTGVLPEWTGRGVAKGLKAHGLLHAKRCGFRYIETNNLAINHAICAINRALGFEVVERRLHTYPIPVTPADRLNTGDKRR